MHPSIRGSWLPPFVEYDILSTLVMEPSHIAQAAISRSRYHAFISYSHAADGRLAPAFQAGLQRLAKPWYRLRAIRVFRDQTGLAVTPELWGAIQSALSRSGYFVLLASPAAAESKWVVQELDWWLHHRSASQILIVWTDGELAWDSAHADFDWANTTALPRRLQGTFPQEPLHLDLRWARSDTDLSLRRPRFAEAIARVAATLRGVSLDDLIGEEVRQHRRTITLLRVAVTMLLVLTVAAFLAAFLAVQARRMVDPIARNEQARTALQASQAKSRQLAAEALNQQASDRDLAILLAAEALRIHPTAEAESALRQSLASSLPPETILGGQANGALFSPDGTKALTWGEEPPRIYASATGKLLKELPGHTARVSYAGFSRDGRRIATAGEDDAARLWNADSGQRQLELSHPGVVAVLLSPDGSSVLTLAVAGEAMLWNATTGAKTASFPYSDNLIFGDRVRDAAFHPDGSRVALCEGFWPVVRDTKTGEILMRLEGHTRGINSLQYSPDGEWLVTASADGTVRRWRSATGVSQTLPLQGTEVNDLQFSPDGKWIVGRDREQLLHVWEAVTAQSVAQIEMFPKPESPVVFTTSPNGKCLLAASLDADTVGLWETKTGVQLGELVGHQGSVWTLGFSPDGTRTIVGTLGAPAQIYASDICGSVQHLLALAGRRVSRQLTTEERHTYLTRTDQNGDRR